MDETDLHTSWKIICHCFFFFVCRAESNCCWPGVSNHNSFNYMIYYTGPEHMQMDIFLAHL